MRKVKIKDMEEVKINRRAEAPEEEREEIISSPSPKKTEISQKEITEMIHTPSEDEVETHVFSSEKDITKFHITKMEIIGAFIILAGILFYFGGGMDTLQFLKNREKPAPESAPPSPSPSTPPESETYVPVKNFIVEESIIPIQKTTEKISSNDTTKLPISREFQSFAYDATTGMNIGVSGTCHDVYYAILVFSDSVDYRKNPSASIINKAFECGKDKSFKTELNLQSSNLKSGTYYFFVADQGERGSWYNPR